jgi:xanthine dehydrogenase YagR molybdenum-binding subunit
MAQDYDPAPQPGRNMGQPIARYEAVQKVTGGKIYADDLPVPGRAAYGWMVTSTIAKGRISGIDDAAARAVPGVQLIMTHENCQPLHELATFADGGMAVTSAAPLAGPDIHHDGQPIALIVADSFEAAREASFKLAVTYDASTATATFGDPGATERNVADIDPTFEPIRHNDVAAALAGSAHTIKAEYRTPIQHHNTIELFSTTAYWEGATLVLHEPNQFVWGLKHAAAQQLGIDPDNVRVKSPFVGGAFGSKAAVTHRTALAAVAARHLGRPVKLVAMRDQGFTHSGHRQETRQAVQLGCDAQGRLTGYEHEQWEFTARTTPYQNGGLEKTAAMYAFQAVRTDNWIVEGDRNAPTFMRSPAEVPTVYALEAAMNELAAAAGIDPVQFRKLNDTRADPVAGVPYTSRSLNECLDAAAERFGWSRRNPAPRSMRDGEWLIGWGCAMAMYPTLMMPSTARLTVRRNGTATIEVAAHDVGTGCYTIASQAAGERLGIAPERITVRMGDSRLPPGPIAGGSVTTASLTSAIVDACNRMAEMLGVNNATDANAFAAAIAGMDRPEAEVVGAWFPAGMDQTAVEALYEGGVRISGGTTGNHAMYAFGAEMVEVRVNERTREICVPRVVGAFAAGRIMNTRTAHSQYLGGLIWGIGSALHEATEIDHKRARYVNDNIAEYLVPVNADISEVDIIMVPETDNEINALGVKGIGELANVGTPAAITDAIWHATGIRVRELPVRIEDLL